MGVKVLESQRSWSSILTPFPQRIESSIITITHTIDFLCKFTKNYFFLSYHKNLNPELYTVGKSVLQIKTKWFIEGFGKLPQFGIFACNFFFCCATTFLTLKTCKGQMESIGFCCYSYYKEDSALLLVVLPCGHSGLAILVGAILFLS